IRAASGAAHSTRPADRRRRIIHEGLPHRRARRTGFLPSQVPGSMSLERKKVHLLCGRRIMNAGDQVMKVVLFGASGMIGSSILDELVGRWRMVTAVARHPEKIKPAAGVTAVQGDATDPASVEAAARGTNAAISAYSPPQTEPQMAVNAARALLAGLGK